MVFIFAFTTLLALLASPFATVAAPSTSDGTIVNLRVEGRDKTIFEGPVFTRGHDVNPPSGGLHHCDGTNNGANPTPGPTATSALDTASKIAGFEWDGTYFAQFDDYFITSIGGDTQTTTEFWAIYLNFTLTPVGGCQQRVELGDNVLFAFDGFSKAHLLSLSGPHTAHVDQPVTLTVTDGATGAPIAGADVNGQVSDSNGHVSVTFGKAGLHGVKATKDDSIRSNKLNILVV